MCSLNIESLLVPARTAFTEIGECEDEVTFVFDDDKKLYVSQNFLHYVSPVFKAMFQHESRERETREVKLPGKDYEDFLEFLLCLHPDIQKPVDKRNVLRLSSIAEEYQSNSIKQKCKKKMQDWLTSEVEEERHFPSAEKTVKSCKTCLQILTKAEYLHYEDLVETALKSIAKFGYTYFTGAASPKDVYPPRTIAHGQKYRTVYKSSLGDDPLEDNKKLYESLPHEIKLRLLSKRLCLCDDSSTL